MPARLWRRTQLRPCAGRRESRPRRMNSGEPEVGAAWLPAVVPLPPGVLFPLKKNRNPLPEGTVTVVSATLVIVSFFCVPML